MDREVNAVALRRTYSGILAGGRYSPANHEGSWLLLVVIVVIVVALVTIRLPSEPTVVRPSVRAQGYNQTVKHYITNRIEGGMQFTCIRCEYSVSTLDFDRRDGDLRSQAATAINRHAVAVHHQPMMYSSLDSKQHIRRA
jgi:hypothetical protein